MDKSDLGITDASKSLCRILLEKGQTVLQDSLFRTFRGPWLLLDTPLCQKGGQFEF
jgi:hypothetical protein